MIGEFPPLNRWLFLRLVREVEKNGLYWQAFAAAHRFASATFGDRMASLSYRRGSFPGPVFYEVRFGSRDGRVAEVRYVQAYDGELLLLPETVRKEEVFERARKRTRQPWKRDYN